jgi:hypothetical protein
MKQFDFETLKHFLGDLEKAKKDVKKLRKLYEAYCERDLTEKEQQHKNFIEDSLIKFASLYGLEIKFNQDPRGIVAILIPDKDYDYYYGIPLEY